MPSLAALSADATSRLRGLCLPLPLPCANTTMPVAPSGTASVPARVTRFATGMRTSVSVTTGPCAARFRSRQATTSASGVCEKSW